MQVIINSQKLDYRRSKNGGIQFDSDSVIYSSFEHYARVQAYSAMGDIVFFGPNDTVGAVSFPTKPLDMAKLTAQPKIRRGETADDFLDVREIVRMRRLRMLKRAYHAMH